VTLLVDDLDQHLAALGERGVETGPGGGDPWRGAQMLGRRSNGNRIQFGQPG
jgi:hypothetical protein